MTRRPVALAPDVGPLAAFAQELRSLRDRLGASAPSIDEISSRENIPRSTLYAALRGQRLPSREVVAALARSWGGDDTEWLAKRSAAESEVARASQVTLGKDHPSALTTTSNLVIDPHAAGQYAVVRQLPAAVAHFTGRVAELAKLDVFLTQDDAVRPVAMGILAIVGTAGVGKTALVVHWAHRVRDYFPDGQLFMNLRGYDPGLPMTAERALEGFLEPVFKLSTFMADSQVPVPPGW